MATFSKYRKKDGSLSYTAQIRVKRKGVVVHSESFTAKKLSIVKTWAAKREAELSEPGAIERLSYSITVGEVLRWYGDFSEKAGKTKASAINFLIGQDIANCDAVTLTVEDCLSHAKRRRQTTADGARAPAGPATILQDFVWLRLAMHAYRVAKNAPVAAQSVEDAMTLLHASKAITKSSKRTRRPTLDELTRIMEYFEGRDNRQQIPMLEIIPFAIFSTRREAEITRIRPADRSGDKILVRDMKHPGGVRDTWAFLTDEAMAILDRQPNGEVYFPYDPKSVGAAFHRACKFLEIKDLRFHDLRHEGASRLFELGWDIPRVANVTGHQSWASLQRYTHLRDRGIVDKFANWKWLPLLRES